MGNLVDQKGALGADGTYEADITSAGAIQITLSYAHNVDGLKVSSSDAVELDLISLLRKLEPKVNNPIFTGAIESIAKALGE